MQFSIRPIRLRPGAQHRISVDVGDELARKGKWIALVSQETGQGKRVRLYLKYRPLALTFLALMVVGYLGAAVTLSLWLDRRPHNLVTFRDVVMPWRWSQLNGLRGEGFALAGMAELEAGNINRAVFYVRRGLGLKPDNEEARLALANFYATGNYYVGVRQILLPQLELGYSRGVAEVLFQQAARADDHPLILETAGDLRQFVSQGSAEEEWLIEQQAGALMAAKQPEAAWQMLRALGRPKPSAKSLWVHVSVAAGEFEEALAIADSAGPALEGMVPLDLILEMVVRAKQGDEERLLELLVELRERVGLDRNHWISFIEALAIAEMDAEARLWVGDFFTRFAAQPGAIEELIKRIAIIGDVEVLRYVIDRASEWKPLGPNMRLPLAAISIQAGNWDALTVDFIDLLQSDSQAGDGLGEWILAVTEAVKPQGAPERLDAFLNQGPRQLMFFRTMADGFAAAERWDLVQRVVDSGLRHHPHSAALQGWNGHAQENLADQVKDTRVDDAMAARRFNYTEDDVPDLRFKFRQMVRAESWDELESLSLRIRRARPVWLHEVEATLDWAEAHAAAARRDFGRLRILAPRVLRDDGEMAAWFTDQAELAVQVGSTESAIRLLEIILAEEEDYDRARTILTELTLVPGLEAVVPSPEPSE